MALMSRIPNLHVNKKNEVQHELSQIRGVRLA